MASTARIFLTGASGYIGGDVLQALRSAHPEYNLTVLLRDDAKVAVISKSYPDVRVVLGDLDSTSLIEEEARQADIIVHAASSSHIKSVEAIARGLARRDGSSPGYWIQVSGASALSISDIVNSTYGQGTDKVFSDVDGANEVRDIIHQNAAKRAIDNFLLNLAGPKTALVLPPIIYGQGRGVIKQRSVQIPELARVAIQTRTAVQVGKGENTWSNVHISDITDIFVKLIEKAVQAEDGNLWNKNGIYFAGNAMVSFKRISQLVAEAVHNLGLADSTSVKELDHDEADRLSAHAGILWGTNAQQNSQRARQVLGWSPKGKSLEEEIPDTVRVEASRLGML
ncbi:hypothetical protein EYZ11_006200 [Aspergillus tanneri]|uniref:NAD-dependent epimerase/dehydratase domain-containing protein n=1 Tax=Aspergillus tanneri TaxID=1220188 RepID=A0A4V3UPA3_9EURO|nr:uncharacterized protein ATNIH1004_003501 [Aspergillus tanneri]KAA8650812.1 hypothetical protein ATNIH1004_003501 [Aspergillus tanneri]THC94324.1 hypothetical protein EYZ11_006200 [Aspergillus tanneri]